MVHHRRLATPQLSGMGPSVMEGLPMARYRLGHPRTPRGQRCAPGECELRHSALPDADSMLVLGPLACHAPDLRAGAWRRGYEEYEEYEV